MFKCERCTVTCGEVERTDLPDVCWDCKHNKRVTYTKSENTNQGIQTLAEVSYAESNGTGKDE